MLTSGTVIHTSKVRIPFYHHSKGALDWEPRTEDPRRRWIMVCARRAVMGLPDRQWLENYTRRKPDNGAVIMSDDRKPQLKLRGRKI